MLKTLNCISANRQVSNKMNKEIREINFKWFCLRLFCYLWTWQCLLTVSGLMFNSEKHSWYPSKGSGFRTNISRSSSNTEKPLVGRNLQCSALKSIQWRQLFLLTSFFNYMIIWSSSKLFPHILGYLFISRKCRQILYMLNNVTVITRKLWNSKTTLRIKY